MRRLPHRRIAAGFTLIELVVSAALMSLILVGAYACLQAGFSTQRLVEPRIDATQGARVALGLIAADLRAACSLDPDTEFSGLDRQIGEVEADNLDFATHHYTPQHPGEGDYCQVSYYADRDPDSGGLALWRRRNPVLALEPFAGGSRDLLITGVQKLRFEYSDGLDWYDTWGDSDEGARQETSWRSQPNLYGLPEAVRITLWLDPERQAATNTPASPSRPRGPPLIFQTVARLNLAARPKGNSSSSSSSRTGANPQPTPP